MDASPDHVPALRLESISKSYGDIKAVRGIDLALDTGEILGLLGPNGSGKSTTMKMVLGILKPDSGEVIVFGEKLSAAQVELKKKLVAVKTDRENATPNALLNVGAAWAMSFSQDPILRALREA